MNKATLTAFATIFILSSAGVTFAAEESIRGEATDSKDSLPRDNQEDLPSDVKDSNVLTPKAKERQTKAPEREREISLQPIFAALDNGFVENSHLYLNLKNQYVNRHYKHAYASNLNTPSGWKQWAQGISLDYVSGYGFGIFGLDASLYGGIKLDGSHPQNAPDELLRTEKDGSRYSKTYARIGRFNAKFRLGDSQNNAVLRYGLIGVDTALLADSDSRLLESSYRGGSVDAVFEELNNLRLYGFYLDRIGFRTGNSYDRLLSSQPGKTIDNIQIYGAGYTFDDLGGPYDYLYLNGEYGVSKNYTRQYFSQASYHLAFDETHSLLANLQYRQGEKAGNLWNGGLDGFDKKAQHFNANVMGTLNSLKLALSYSQTRAKNDKSDGAGVNSYQFKSQLTANDYGKAAYWTSRQISNFNYDKESAYQAMVGYDFTDYGLAGLDARLTHTYGTGMNKATGLENEQETDLNISYAFQQQELKGLSLQLEHAWYVSRHITGSTIAAGKRLSDLRIFANYNLAVF